MLFITNGKDTFDKPIMNNGLLEYQFDISQQSRQSCSQAPLYSVIQDNKSPIKQKFEILMANTGTYEFAFSKFPTIKCINDLDLSPILSSNEFTKELIINKGSYIYLNLSTNCADTVDDRNYWGQMQVEFYPLYQNPFSIYFDIICQLNYRQKSKFDWSLPVLIIFQTLIVYVLARFERIKSFKNTFIGFRINYKYTIGYVMLFAACGALILLKEDYLSFFILVATVGLGALSCFFLFSEIFCLISKQNPLKTVLFAYKNIQIKILHIFSLLIAAAMVALWFILNKPWYINDIISICLIGSLIKLFKITSMKNALILIGVSSSLEVLIAITIHLAQPESYDTLAVSTFSNPGQLQIPSFTNQRYNKICTWIPISVPLFCGFFQAYCHRFDLTQNTNLYTLLSFGGQILGMLIWMISTIWNQYSWPILIFTWPFQFFFSSFWAWKNGQFQTLFDGQFYDYMLHSPEEQKYYEDQAQKEEEKTVRDKKTSTIENLDPGLFTGLRVSEEPHSSNYSSGGKGHAPFPQFRRTTTDNLKLSSLNQQDKQIPSNLNQSHKQFNVSNHNNNNDMIIEKPTEEENMAQNSIN